MNKEQIFYHALKNIFLSAKMERESGYINLMRIKSVSVAKKGYL